MDHDWGARPPVPARITIALNKAGLHGPQVDVDCGAVEPAVDRWELGLDTPTPQQLVNLAALTGFPVSWFFLPHTRVRAVVVCGRGSCATTRHPVPRPPVLDNPAALARARQQPPTGG